MTTKIFLSESGVLMAGEFPEPPETLLHDTHQKYQHAITKWEAAVEAAKASAVEIINMDTPTAQFQFALSLGGLMTKGKLYDLPPGWTVEYGEQYRTNSALSKNSRLPHWMDIPDSNDPLYRIGETRKIARLIPSASGIAAIGISEQEVKHKLFEGLKGKGLDKHYMFPNSEHPQSGAGDPYPIFEQFSLLKKQNTIATTGTELNSPVIPEGSEKAKTMAEKEAQHLADVIHDAYKQLPPCNLKDHLAKWFDLPADKQAIDDTLKGDIIGLQIDRLKRLPESTLINTVIEDLQSITRKL
jgi:hypothetical protein